MSATSVTFIPAGTLPGSLGTRAWVKPSRCASAKPALHAGHPSDLAREADFTDRDEVLGQRGVAGGAGEGEGDGEVGGGLGELHAADGRGVDVPLSQGADPPALLEHGEHHRDARRLQAGRGAPGEGIWESTVRA